MTGRDRQPRAGGRVEPPLEHVTFAGQRARNAALDCALAFGTNIDEYRLCFVHRLIGLIRSQPSKPGTCSGKHLINAQGPGAVCGFLSRHVPLPIEPLSLLRRAFAWNQSTPIQLVLVHLAKRRRICVNADGRREGDVTDIMHVIGTKCARLARMYHAGPLVGMMLLKTPGRYDEGSRGRTVIMEAGGLSWQPADHPYVIVQTVIEPLIPTPFGAQPHFIHPSLRRREPRDDAGELLRRSRDRAG